MANIHSKSFSLVLTTSIKNFVTNTFNFNPVTASRNYLMPHLFMCSLLLIAALGLISCGGGSGNDGGKVIAPESLDNVQMEFFGAFTMQCLRLSGTAGNEQGAATFVQRRQSFRYATTAPGGNLGYTIDLPLLLSDISYNYVRTGPDSGRVTFTFTNNQVYPHPEATALDPQSPPAIGDMFWGGRNNLATELVVDILFTNRNGFIGSTTSRIRSGYVYNSTWNTTTMSADNSAFVFDFDTPEISYRFISGGEIPVGYNPYRDLKADDPSRAVWKSLQDREILFSGVDGIDRIINQQTVTGVGVPIGVSNPEESGRILIDEGSTTGVAGDYSYHRTGGNNAKFGIRYNRINPTSGLQETVTLIFDMNFNSLDGGTYVDDQGVSGTFLQNTLQPL